MEADEEPTEEEEELEEELEDDGQEYCYGIPIASMTDGIQPLELVILVQGINMETGSPTMTMIGSEGITPWAAAGMMTIELERIKMMTIMHSYTEVESEEEEDE